MDITINLTDGVPIYRQIVNQVKYLVASGLLRAGEELPAPPWQSTATAAAPDHPGEPRRGTAPASLKVLAPRRAEHGAPAQVAVHGVVPQLHWSQLVLLPAGR